MSITFNVPSIPRARQDVPVGVFRYEPGVGFQPLAAVKPVEVTIREGASPSKALFEYISGDYLPDMTAIGFEQVLPIVNLGDPRVVMPDERIVVAAILPDGTLRFMFDGFAHMPEGKFDDKHTAITFVAQGVEIRLWDDVIGYAMMRDAGDPLNPTGDVWVGLPVRFNPKVGFNHVGNKIIDGYESTSSGGRKMSVFVDPLSAGKRVTVKGEDKAVGQLWSLFDAVNYIMSEANPDEEYVKMQTVDYLKKLLSVIVPKSGKYKDADDKATYDLRPIIVPDRDVTGEPWPEAVEKLLKPNGYAMCFRLDTDGNGNPQTYLDIYKLNEESRKRYKDLYLQTWNDVLDPGSSNLGQAQFAMDISNIVNQVAVDTSPVRWEVGAILTPLFEIETTDIDDNKNGKFDRKAPDFKSVRDKFRLFGVDEIGDGHQVLTVGAPDAQGRKTITNLEWKKDAFSFHDLFGDDSEGDPLWVERRRPAFSQMWTKDKAGQYLRAELYISIDYDGPNPAIWDGTSGTWYRVTGGFELCDDRLGIRVTAEKPNAWSIGKMPKGAPTGIASGEVRVVDWLGKPVAADRKAFTLLLICTIESDQHLNVLSERSDVSPTTFPITRIVDLRDKLRPGKIHKSSKYHPTPGSGEPVDTGGEKAEATDYADGKRESRQLGSWAGSAMIPRISNAYIIGDRIRSVVGRDANMQTNMDGNGQEAPSYPRVVGITWTLGGTQATTLTLADKRADYAGTI